MNSLLITKPRRLTFAAMLVSVGILNLTAPQGIAGPHGIMKSGQYYCKVSATLTNPTKEEVVILYGDGHPSAGKPVGISPIAAGASGKAEFTMPVALNGDIEWMPLWVVNNKPPHSRYGVFKIGTKLDGPFSGKSDTSINYECRPYVEVDTNSRGALRYKGLDVTGSRVKSEKGNKKITEKDFNYNIKIGD